MLGNLLKHIWRHLGLLILCMTLLACSKSFVVEGEVPQPLIARLPIKANLILSEEFKNFTYSESDKRRPIHYVEFGKAQVDMFEKVFSETLILTEADAKDLDLSIEPELISFQYASPIENKINVFEVWLKYRVQIKGSQGEEVADWVLAGYGKTPGGIFLSPTKAFNSASLVALRDIGAQLALGFNTQASIIDYFEQKAKGVRNGNHQQPSSEQDQELDPELNQEQDPELNQQQKLGATQMNRLAKGSLALLTQGEPTRIKGEV